MKTLESRGLTYGLFTTAGLIGFFFIMKMLGLEHNFNLRILNAFIMMAGVYFSIKSYKKERKTQFQFLQGAGVGLITTLTTALSFTIFVVLYVLSNPLFLAEIQATEPQGLYLNVLGIAIVIFIEAGASGFLFTYLSMQWLKSDDMADLNAAPSVNQ